MKKWLIMILVIVLLVSGCSTGVYLKMIPNLKEYGKMEIERFNQLIISHCYFTSDSQYQNLVVIERGEDNEIELLDFDMVKVNELATAIVMDIEQTYASLETGTYIASDESYYQKRLQEVSRSGIVSQIPIATLLNLPALSFLSPSIPVRYKHLSSVGSSIVKSIENYGVNHVMVELSIEVKMNLTMVYPFFIQYHTHAIKIPVLLEIFQGQVPLVYSH
ncbi:sporulation protein YunB [Candidatus Stoquefichus massiliensis]|uniref:sporulation protein YunB n=1 Tax=Candidatus Stoquefichus massiliensis TaxID=1470350 RepID=UPI0004869595|nr:sporulation protein YunB [Candidatus Stoquefichus massiliensis]